jgi:hypothetical protein
MADGAVRKHDQVRLMPEPVMPFAWGMLPAAEQALAPVVDDGKTEHGKTADQNLKLRVANQPSPVMTVPVHLYPMG